MLSRDTTIHTDRSDRGASSYFFHSHLMLKPYWNKMKVHVMMKVNATNKPQAA